jgi:hypothetical protein
MDDVSGAPLPPPDPASDPAPAQEVGSAHELEAARETVTMALYISLSLLAVLLATPNPGPEDHRVTEAVIVLVTGVGLVAAHHLAFRMSSRLVNAGVLSPASVSMLGAQALGGLPIAVLAALPVLVFGVDWGTAVSEVLLLALVCIVGYRSVRPAMSRGRAVLYLLGVVLVAGLVIGLKLVVGH